MGAISFDAVRHLQLCRIERRPPRPDLANWPHLPMASVRTTQAGDYMALRSPHRPCRHARIRRWCDEYPAGNAHARYTADSTGASSPRHCVCPPSCAEYDKVARQCAQEKTDFPRYFTSPDRVAGVAGPRSPSHGAPHPPGQIPQWSRASTVSTSSLSPRSTRRLCWNWLDVEFLSRKENLLLLGNSGTGKSHVALALYLAACQRGHRVRFTTAAALVSELIEARDEKHLLRFQNTAGSLRATYRR